MSIPSCKQRFFQSKKCRLVLEDGSVFEGTSFGADKEAFGEVVFNTSMWGYQEILTDPSYKGQMVVMTYPLIGNYGIHSSYSESSRIHAEALIVREYCHYPNHFLSEQSLDDFLKEHGIIGLQGIDTRALTRKIRSEGELKALITTSEEPIQNLVDKVRASPGLVGRDLVQEVTCSETYTVPAEGAARYHIIAFDFGIKRSILKSLSQLGGNVTVVPADTTAHDILQMNPDGIFLSNGPGDPSAVQYAVQSIQTLMGKKPIFGICLGHQLLGLAVKGATRKLHFGHHGGNHPVLNKLTQKVEITSQNHGFVVEPEGIADHVITTHVNLNDHTLEGMESRDGHFFSVQYHPESSPGPHDSSYLFQQFFKNIEKRA